MDLTLTRPSDNLQRIAFYQQSFIKSTFAPQGSQAILHSRFPSVAKSTNLRHHMGLLRKKSRSCIHSVHPARSVEFTPMGTLLRTTTISLPADQSRQRKSCRSTQFLSSDTLSPQLNLTSDALLHDIQRPTARLSILVCRHSTGLNIALNVDSSHHPISSNDRKCQRCIIYPPVISLAFHET